MTEDMSSISDFELIQSNDVINIEKNLNNAENVLVEEKNKLFENEIKMEIQKLKSDHKNEIEEIKINFQQFFNEKIKEILIKNKEEKNKLEMKNQFLENGMKILKEETNEEIQKLKTDHKKEIEEIKINFQQFNEKINEEKDKKEKIEIKNQLLENGIKILKEETKETIALFEKKICELTSEMDKLNNLNNKQVSFVQIINKWDRISGLYECCKNKCINTKKPFANCIKGNGFINLINEENIKYIKGKGIDKKGRVYGKYLFNKPKEDLNNYSLFYFEIKCFKIDEGDKNYMSIGHRNCNNKCIRFHVKYALIKNEEDEEFKINNFFWNNNDIFGCGLIYPPKNKINKLPYIFFTQNGKQIGKAVLANENCISYIPYVSLNGCSVEANFGNDLETKPFIYDIRKHFLAKQFY
ncbi:hypothetical protein ACQ4LE_008360 [Meloidogyne hapla]|uniref:SPRY domain-containing protein n=1 Tax=Meloidogyne hapla TaxID=6305 RepID=A0A1I8BZP4_MELHA